MPRRVIVVFPELPAASPIHELRRRFDPLAAVVPPHLTLVFPFDSELTSAQLREHIRAATAGIAAFPIALSRVTGSEGEYVFLNVKKGNDQLIALHDRLYTGALEPMLSIEHTFTPHLTLGRLADRASWRQALELAQTFDVRLDTTVAELSVYQIATSGPRQVELVVALDLG